MLACVSKVTTINQTKIAVAVTLKSPYSSKGDFSRLAVLILAAGCEADNLFITKKRRSLLKVCSGALSTTGSHRHLRPARPAAEGPCRHEGGFAGGEANLPLCVTALAFLARSNAGLSTVSCHVTWQEPACKRRASAHLRPGSVSREE